MASAVQHSSAAQRVGLSATGPGSHQPSAPERHDHEPSSLIRTGSTLGGGSSVLAYNLGNLWRRLILPPGIKRWALTSLQQRLVKTGGRLVKHARYYWLLLAEGHLNRRLFGEMLRRIWALPVPAG